MTNRPRMRKRKRKLRQVLFELKEVIYPTEIHVPEVAEIPLPEEPSTVIVAVPPSPPSLKRRSW